MTQRVVRNVAADTLAEAKQVHVEPYRIVKITFPIAGDKYYSEGQETDFGGNIYLEAALQIGRIRWTKDGQQTGNIKLFNSENNDAFSLVLSNRIAGNAIEIYQTYRTGAGTYTTPVLTTIGECSEAVFATDGSYVTISILTANAGTQFVPHRYFTPDEGFNHIPATGKTITYGNEIFTFERAN